MENGLTRAMTIIALACFLVVGAAAASILGRDSVPAARLEMASPVVKSPVSNRESKKDRLAVVALALASFEPPQTASLCIREPCRPPAAEGSRARGDAGRTAGAAKAEACRQAASAKILRVAQRCADRRDQGAAQTFFRPGILLAGGGKRVARGGPQDSRNPQGRSKRHRHADRSRRRRSSATEIGRDAAVVPVARGSKAGSAHACPHHRAGKGRVDDLSGLRGLFSWTSFLSLRRAACYTSRTPAPLAWCLLSPDSTRPRRALNLKDQTGDPPQYGFSFWAVDS